MKKGYFISKADLARLIEDIGSIDVSDPERAHGQLEELIESAMPPPIRRACAALRDRADWWANA